MSTITIGGSERAIDEVTSEWIEREIRHKREHHRNVCVRLSLHHGTINMVLATPGCASGGGGRAPNAREQEIFAEWSQRGLNTMGWTLHNLIAFVKHIRHLFN